MPHREERRGRGRQGKRGATGKQVREGGGGGNELKVWGLSDMIQWAESVVGARRYVFGNWSRQNVVVALEWNAEGATLARLIKVKALSPTVNYESQRTHLRLKKTIQASTFAPPVSLSRSLRPAPTFVYSSSLAMIVGDPRLDGISTSTVSSSKFPCQMMFVSVCDYGVGGEFSGPETFCQPRRISLRWQDSRVRYLHDRLVDH